MSDVREEYTKETYPSFGKKYNGEKAVISLTSWKARINTVSKTLYSLLTQCKGFHIVLVLSEEEFPKMMDELPENLKLFVDNELIEVLWVYKNYKSFKKVLFTMDKYRTVPVISADDDCIYTCNYAQELYDKWAKDRKSIYTYDLNPGKSRGYSWCRGPATIYPINVFHTIVPFLSKVRLKRYVDDDAFICAIRLIKHISMTYMNKSFSNICIFHTKVSPNSNNGYDAIREIKEYIKMIKPLESFI